MSKTLASIILLLCSFYLFANSKIPPVQSIEKQNGIALGVVTAVHQDQNHLWIGTQNGIFKFAGASSEYYHTGNSALTNNYVRHIAEDLQGNILISTWGGGLNLFDTSTNEFISIDSEKFTFVNQITAALTPSPIVGTEKGVMKVDYAKRQLVSVLPENWEFSFTPYVIQQEENIWFSRHNQGVERYNLGTKKHHVFNKKSNTLVSDAVSVLFADSKNRVWVGTTYGISLFEENAAPSINLLLPAEKNTASLANDVRKIYEDKNGKILIAYAEHGLHYFDEQSRSILPFKALAPYLSQFPIKNIFDMQESAHGELLIATRDDGVLILPATYNALSYVPIPDEIPALDISTMHQVENGAFIAANNNLYLFDSVDHSLTKIVSNVGYILDIEAISDNTLLLSIIDKGLAKLHLKDLSLSFLEFGELGLPNPLDANITSIAVSFKDNIYLGFSNGLNGVYKGTLEHGFKLDLKDVSVRAIERTQKGELYVASAFTGLYHLEGGENWINIRAKTDEQRNQLRCVLEDNKGDILFCTSGAGIGVIEKGTSVPKYIDLTAFGVSNFVRDLMQDSDGFMWVLTGQGLLRFNPVNNEHFLLSAEDGILSYDFSLNASIQLNSQALLLAGNKEAIILNTSKMNRYISDRVLVGSQITIKELSVHRKDEETTDNAVSISLIGQKQNTDVPVVLDYKDFLFQLEFSHNNFEDAHLVEYEYRLIGLDDNWEKTAKGQNLAIYTTLPSGEYRFEVRAIDPRSKVAQPLTFLNINVLPPFWKTWQAYLLYGIVAILLFYGIFRYRTHQLKSRNRELKKAVETRTTELSQRSEQLAQSKKTVEGLLNKKETLFTNISHEFRTPLTLIISPLQGLTKSLKGESEKTTLSAIERNAKRLLNMVDQILELAKLDTAKNLPHQVYSLKQSVEAICQSFLPLAELKSQTILYSVEHEVEFELLQDSMEKILSNLLSNALKYTPHKSRVMVTAKVLENTIELKINDNGPGIEEDKLPVIFERFARLEQGENISGSGIGLALVEELVKANNGKIGVKSIVGVGTSFTINLPIKKTARQDIDTVKVFSPDRDMLEWTKEEEVDVDTKGKKVALIVEDNKDLRRFIKQSLSGLYHCIVAIDGEDGLIKAKEMVPDLIISDVLMPKKNGFELAKALREDELTSHIPIVLLTAKGDKESRMEGWQSDVDDYIEKPFDVDELLVRLERLMSVRSILKKRYGQEISNEIGQQDGHAAVRFEDERDKAFFDKFQNIVSDSFSDENFNRAQAAQAMLISERQLNRKLSSLIDHNFSEYLRKYRLEKARALLLEGKQITEVGYSVGFSSPAYFSTCFKAEFGESPKAFLDNLTESC